MCQIFHEIFTHLPFFCVTPGTGHIVTVTDSPDPIVILAESEGWDAEGCSEDGLGTEPNKDITLELVNALQDRIFKKFFDVAEIANLSKDEYVKYLESEKVYYDNDGAIRTAEAKGRAKERLANAKALLGNGVPLELIVKSLNLTKEEADLITLSLDQ